MTEEDVEDKTKWKGKYALAINYERRRKKKIVHLLTSC